MAKRKTIVPDGNTCVPSKTRLPFKPIDTVPVRVSPFWIRR